MPVATPPTVKRLCKRLWLQGYSNPEIEERTKVSAGLLRQWQSREKWVRGMIDVEEIAQPVQVAKVTKDNTVADALSKKAIEQVDRILCHVQRMEFKNLNDCKTASSAVAAAYATARKALGLDDRGDGGTTYQLYLASAPKPLLDVESTLIQCPSDSGTGGGGGQLADGQGDNLPSPGTLTDATDLGGGI
jgi:hypothetical protein